MKLRTASLLIAQDLQEAADSLTASDTRSALSDAVDDIHKGSGSYGYLLDHMGDDESGDAVYRSNGETMQAPYSMTGGNGFAKKAKIDSSNAMKVRGRMVYEPTCDEGDHIAAMSEAFIAAKLYTELPVYERFVSKDERDKADDSDFAGKGKSFPILKREDVMAAVRSIGRAGADNSSSATIKANIIAIAKRKGWADELPKAWKVKPAESARAKESMRLIESMPGAGFLEKLTLREGARTSYPVLLITPGTGSTAHYSSEVLKKAADEGKFPAKTFMYWNHPTQAQEAARPEGDLDDLAAVTTSAGVWNESGPKGPGIYANAKPMADYAEKIDSRAPHIGVSIRAGGTKSGKTVNGKPDLASIDFVESVDYVTRAGRGGMALAESAKFTKLLESFNEGEVSEMDAAEIKKLQESLAAQTAINARLLERALRADALELAGAVLATTSLTEAQRKFVAESVVNSGSAPTKDGVLDAAKLTESVNAFAKSYSATLPATGGVRGMGAGLTVVQESAEVKSAREAQAKESQGAQVKALMELGLSEAAAKESVGVAA